MFARLSLLMLFLLGAVAVVGQTTGSQITGLVVDPTGLAAPGAVVTVRNQDTGVIRQAESNQTGNFAAPLLEPGLYTVTVRKEGFKLAERQGVLLNVNSVVRLDFVLEMGSVTEAVSVTADPPLLQTSESSLRSVVDNRKVVELPLNGRNPFDLVFLAPGTQAYRRTNLPGNNIPLSNMSINGGPAMANEVLLDGIPSTSPQFNQFTVVPSIDAVQEFEVKTNNMSAEFGRTAGGVVNVAMRSGTNRLRGTLYNFLRNDVLDSNTWLNNRTGEQRPPLRFNQFGASLGGPIRQDRTFYFVNYEGIRRTTGRTFQFSVPTAEQRGGDFSQTLAINNRLVEIFDPTTVRPQGSGYVRDAFPGNRIPNSRMNAVSRNLLPFWAGPNRPGNPGTGVLNFVKNSPEKFDVNQFNLRTDHTFTDANRIFVRFSRNTSVVRPPLLFDDPVANPSSGPQQFTQHNFAINDTHSFSPSTYATFRAGFTRLVDSNYPYGGEFDAGSLGFQSSYLRAQAAAVFPTIIVNGFSIANVGFGTSSLGPVNNTIINNASNAYTAQTDFTHVRGGHVLKAGFESRLFRSGGFRPVQPSFTFSPGLTQGPNPQLAGINAGHSFASFLLGLAGGGNAQNNASQDIQSYYHAAFLQDDYKLTSRLTLNLGFRVETENLRTDRYNRLNVLDLVTASPLAVPGFGTLTGGLAFVGAGGLPRDQADVLTSVSPRFGFAYQLNGRTVLRGGYGIFIAPRTGWDFTQLGQAGFSATTPHVASPDGINIAAYYSDPFPAGLISPTGASLGLLTDAGGAINAPDRHQKPLTMQHWNFNVQRQFPGSLALELTYAGSRGTHLWQNLQLNQIPDQALAQGTALQRVVDNPFFGLIPAAQPLGRRTVNYGQLLRPYPHFNGVSTIGSTSGASSFHSFQLRAEKRYSQGLNFLIGYTFSKLIDDGAPGSRIAWLGNVPNFQNHNDRRSERSVSSQQGPQRLSIASGYELPFGRGKAFASALPAFWNGLIGGWQINGLAALQSGIPLAMATAVNNTNSFGGGSRPNSTGVSAALSGPTLDRLGGWFDTTAFTQPAPFTFGNVGRTLPDVRGPANINFDLSAIKNIALTERISAQLRGEAFNVFNNTNFAQPNTSVGSPVFGTINAAGGARIIQLGLKVNF